MLPEIVDANDFYKECSNFIANRKAFNVAVAELIHRGEVVFTHNFSDLFA